MFWFYTDLDRLKKKRMDWQRKINSETNQTSLITGIGETSGPSKLKLIHFAGLFCLYAFGLFCSFVFYIWESWSVGLKAFKQIVSFVIFQIIYLRTR